MRNARFWLFSHSGDWVKLTLKPSQTLSWGSFSEDEEGWTRVRRSTGVHVCEPWPWPWSRASRPDCAISMPLDPPREPPTRFAPRILLQYWLNPKETAMKCQFCGRTDARIRESEIPTARITGRAHIDQHPTEPA